MNKKILFITLFLFSAVFGFAQDKKLDKNWDILTPYSIDVNNIPELLPSSFAVDSKFWSLNGMSSFTLSQVALKNWAEGGDQSISGNFLFRFQADKAKNRHIWNNLFEAEIGGLKTTGTEENVDEGIRKTADRLYFFTKYGYKLGNKWYFSALADFKTQFAKGYNYPNTDTYISRIMSPGYLTVAVGFDYIPFSGLELTLSPIADKMTFVVDDSLSTLGSFGVDPGGKVRVELGPYVRLSYVKENIVTRVNLETRLDLFTNYANDFGNIDVNWDVLLVMNINKYLVTTLSTTLKYDDDIDYIDSKGQNRGPRTQFKEILGVGLTYNFSK